MPSKFALHTTLLVAAVTGVYLWVASPYLYSYTLQLVGLLVLAYAGAHWFRHHSPGVKKRRVVHTTSIPLDLTLLTTMMLLLIVETGALISPFFFFLYFLLFAVALLYEIEATLVLTGTLILFFLLLPSTDLADMAHLSQLAALLMVTPLAIFTGHQKEQIIETEHKAKLLKGHITQEETDTLTFLSLNLKSTLTSALDNLSLTVPQTKVKKVRENLHILYQDLRNLYRSADELQQLIDKETDNS